MVSGVLKQAAVLACGVAIGLFVGSMAFVKAAPRQEPTEILKVHRLEIVDKDGHTVAVLAADKDGGGTLAFENANETLMAGLGVGKDSCFLSFVNKKAKEKSFSLNESALSFKSPKARADLGALNDKPFIRLELNGKSRYILP